MVGQETSSGSDLKLGRFQAAMSGTRGKVILSRQLTLDVTGGVSYVDGGYWLINWTSKYCQWKLRFFNIASESLENILKVYILYM